MSSPLVRPAPLALAIGLLTICPAATRTRGLDAGSVARRGASPHANVEGGTWTIGNSQIEARFAITAADGLVLETFTDLRTGRALNSAAADAVVTINGITSALGSGPGGWTLDGVDAGERDDAAHLSFAFHSSKAPLVVVRSYACVEGSPAIEAWTSFQIRGSSSVTVSNPNVWQLSVPAGTVHFVNGLRGDSAAVRVDEAFMLRDASIGPGASMVLEEHNRSTEQYLPLISADLPTDEFFGGLLWSGSWQMTIRRAGPALRVSAGLPTMNIAVDASHPLETPHGFFGFTPGGRYDVSAALHAYVVRGLRRGRPFPSLVTSNTWFSYGTEIDERSMIDEMTAAAEAGVELFVVDAGWYLGAGKGNDFASGLGSWQVDPARFPDGLASLREYAHSLGMQFGLWVEPERVNRSTVGKPQLAQEAWLATNNGSYKSPATPQICFGSAAARQWILDRLTRLLDEVRPDYLKWDNNLWVNCTRAGHGHGATDGNFAHVRGLYEVLEALRDRYPDLLIENCSQGGNRADFGMLRYTDAAWMDDRTVPSVHVRHNLEGLMTFFPPAYLLSFEVDHSEEPVAGAADLELLLRSRMMGILGLTYRAAELDDADRERLAREIGVYKTLREITRDASGAVLTGQAEPDGGPAWDGVQEQSAATGESVIFAFQNDGAARAVTLRPHGLDNDGIYAIANAGGARIGTARGADLMLDGIRIEESPESAARVLVLRPLERRPGGPQ